MLTIHWILNDRIVIVCAAAVVIIVRGGILRAALIGSIGIICAFATLWFAFSGLKR